MYCCCVCYGCNNSNKDKRIPPILFEEGPIKHQQFNQHLSSQRNSMENRNNVKLEVLGNRPSQFYFKDCLISTVTALPQLYGISHFFSAFIATFYTPPHYIISLLWILNLIQGFIYIFIHVISWITINIILAPLLWIILYVAWGITLIGLIIIRKILLCAEEDWIKTIKQSTIYQSLGKMFSFVSVVKKVQQYQDFAIAVFVSMNLKEKLCNTKETISKLKMKAKAKAEEAKQKANSQNKKKEEDYLSLKKIVSDLRKTNTTKSQRHTMKLLKKQLHQLETKNPVLLKQKIPEEVEISISDVIVENKDVKNNSNYQKKEKNTSKNSLKSKNYGKNTLKNVLKLKKQEKKEMKQEKNILNNASELKKQEELEILLEEKEEIQALLQLEELKLKKLKKKMKFCRKVKNQKLCYPKFLEYLIDTEINQYSYFEVLGE